jgi:hypothetical protein
MPSLHEMNSTTSANELESARSEKLFWQRNAVRILKEHKKDILRDEVRTIASQTIDYNEEQFNAVLDTIEAKYEQKGERKFVHEPEVNHAYQVALLVAHFFGPRQLHHDTFIAALGHDLYENTDLSPGDITELTNPRIYKAIAALSHKSGGEPIYPNAEDKRPYFSNLLRAHKEEPNLQILLIKEMDQLAVANGPLTAKELKSPDMIPDWKRMRRNKLSDMELLGSMLDPEDTNGAQLLKRIKRFTRMQSIPGIGSAARVVFTHMPKHRPVV